MKDLKGNSSGRKLPDEIIVDDVSYHNKSDILEKLFYFFSTTSDKLRSEHSANQDKSDYDFGKLHGYVGEKIPGDAHFKIPLMKHSDLTVQLNH